MDPVAKAMAETAGLEYIELSFQRVLPALENNEIQTVYTSPLACIALGWHTQVKYMADLRIVAGVGATVISKSRYEELSEEHRNLLRKIMREHHQQLIATIREQNKESIDILVTEHGITRLAVSSREREIWDERAKRVQMQFVKNGFFSQALLDKTKELLIKFRAAQQND